MLRKLFFDIKMTWTKVIVLAVVTAVFTAAVLILPATADTSLANMGVTPEAWFLFALIIILNCEKPLEAGIKTFVFFLVGQPLIYLLQVPFYSGGWAIFDYYRRWFLITLATFPGGIVAWYVKKDNLLSGLILSVATGYLVFQGDWFLRDYIYRAENLLSAVFCFILALVFLFTLLKNKKARTVALVITLLVALGSVYYLYFSRESASVTLYYDVDSAHSWTITEKMGDDIGDITISDSGMITAELKKNGVAEIVVKNELGETKTLVVNNKRGVSPNIDEKTE